MPEMLFPGTLSNSEPASLPWQYWFISHHHFLQFFFLNEKISSALKELFWYPDCEDLNHFSFVSAPIFLLIGDHLWDCSAVVFKVTSEQHQGGRLFTVH